MTYQLTPDPDCIQCLDTGALIPRGHWMWEAYEAWCAEGNIPQPVPAPSESERIEAIRQGIGVWMDNWIRTAKGYDSMVSCTSYVGDPRERYNLEGLVARQWRSDVWDAAEALNSNPPDGVATLEQVIALLPQPGGYEWPPTTFPGSGPTDEESAGL